MSAIIDNFDYNSRLAPSLDVSIYKEAPQKYTPERIVAAVLPLLAAVPVLSFGLQFYAGSRNSMNAMSVLKKSSTLENKANCALQVASLALLFFNPLAISIIELTKGIYHNTLNCKNHMENGKYKKALIETAHLAKNIVYIASIVTGGTNLILISMVSQGVFELYKSKQFYNKGMYLEALVQSVMAVSRGSMIVKTHQKEIKESFENFKTQFSKLGTVGAKSKAADYYADSVHTDENGVHVAGYSDGTTVHTSYGRGFGTQFYLNGKSMDYSFTWIFHLDDTLKATHTYNDRKIVTDLFRSTQYIRIS